MTTPDTPEGSRPGSADPTSWAPPSSTHPDPQPPQGAVGGTPAPDAPSWGAAPDPGTAGWAAPASSGGYGAAPTAGAEGIPGTTPGATPGSGSGAAAGWGPGPDLPGTPGTGPTGDAYGTSASWMPAPQPGVIPLRPLLLGDLFDGTFRTIRANPAVMFGFSVALLAIMSLIGAVIEGAFSNSLYSVLDDPQAAIDNDLTGTASSIAGMLVSNLGTTVLTVLASAILSGILALTVSDAVLGRVTALGEAWARVRPRIWPLIGTSILVSVISSVAVLVVLAVFSIPLVVAATSGSGISAGAVLPTLLGIPLALALLLFLSVRLIFAPVVVVLEDLGPLAALRRSWALTGGGFWRVCGRLLLIGIITSVASGFIGGAVGMLAALFMLVSSPAVGVAVTTFLAGLASGLVVPITAAFQTLMYVDERMRKENLAPVLARAAQEG